MADNLGPSLAELDNPAPITSVTPPAEGGDQKTQAQIEQEALDASIAAQAKADEEAAAKLQNQDPPAGDDNKQDTGDQPGDQPPADDGTEETEAQRLARVQQEAADFYGTVNKYHGFDQEPFTVDYGGVDPLSPEGIYKRDQALIAYADAQHEQAIKEADPRAYEFFLHRKAGKPEEEFFQKPSVALPNYEALKDNLDLQKQLVTEDLKSKGLRPGSIEREISELIKEGELFNEADSVYKNRQDTQQKAIDALAALNKQQADEQVKAINAFEGLLDNVINKGNTKNIIIPDQKRKEFTDFVKSNLYYNQESKTFQLVRDLNSENISDIIEQEFFGYTKGNLDQIVRRKAQTATVTRLRTQVERSKASPSGNPSRTSGNKPLGEL